MEFDWELDEEERKEIAAHIEEDLAQAERGELISEEEAIRRLKQHHADWLRNQRVLKPS
jgi:predicted transcriptional regulator